MAIEWKGVMPAVTTKFTDTDGLDIPAFKKNIKAHEELTANYLNWRKKLNFKENE